MFPNFFTKFATGSHNKIIKDIARSSGFSIHESLHSDLRNAIFNQQSTINHTNKVDSADNIINTKNQIIPIIFGKSKIKGKIIWAKNIEEIKNSTKHNKDIFGINKHIDIDYDYYIDLAIGLCEGEISTLHRCWINSEEVPLNKLTYRFYNGSEIQKPDPLLEKKYNKNTPSYRGLSYIVVENFNLKNYRGKIPEFFFEVQKYDFSQYFQHNNLLKNIVITPGFEDSSYNINIIKEDRKLIHSDILTKSVKKNNNTINSSPALKSLNDLENISPNLKWVSPINYWYASSNNISDCIILPGTNNPENINWQVSKINSKNAIQLQRVNNKAIFPSTDNDAALKNYIIELKKRKLKVFFSPKLIVNNHKNFCISNITATTNDIKNFFRKDNGYNNFILHYARLLKDLVDGFSIGSDLSNLIKIKNSDDNSPVVEELIFLSEKIRSILNHDVKIAYSSSSSEFDHDEIKNLWLSKNIDIIGINVCLNLLTNNANNKSLISKIDRFNQKILDFTKILTLNNNKIFNKEIWLTELGYTSTPNYNIHFDDKTSNNHENNIDYVEQYKSLFITLDKFNHSTHIKKIFILCWNNKPYPELPHYNTNPTENNNWVKGYALNSKINLASLSSIIESLCYKCGLDKTHINVKELEEFIIGLTISDNISAYDVLKNLQKIYFFDLNNIDHRITFTKNHRENITNIPSKDLISSINNVSKLALNKNKYYDLESPNQLMVNYVNENYELNSKIFYSCKSKNYNDIYIHNIFPIIQEPNTEKIANNYFSKLKEFSEIYQFSLPIKYFFLSLGDNISIDRLQLRIISIKIHSKINITVTAALNKNKEYYT